MDVPITDPFVVATGSRTVAENVFLRITLANDAQGYGEAAPFPEVGGETRESSFLALQRLGKASFSLVLGLGGFDILDLDTPLLLTGDGDPATGGYRYDRSRLQPWSGPGLDMNAEPSTTITTIE